MLRTAGAAHTAGRAKPSERSAVRPGAAKASALGSAALANTASAATERRIFVCALPRFYVSRKSPRFFQVTR